MKNMKLYYNYVTFLTKMCLHIVLKFVSYYTEAVYLGVVSIFYILHNKEEFYEGF